MTTIMTNTEYYDKLKKVPQTALKTIQAGRLKGKLDINPQWKYERMTEVFGPCGIGWKYIPVSDKQVACADGQILLFTEIALYVKDGDKWSEAIPGFGGDFIVKKESNGLYYNDEAYKMANTDALGNAMKMIGVAADVFRGLANDSKYGREPQNTASTSKSAESKPIENEPAPKPKVIKVNGNTKLLTNAGYVSLQTIDKEKLQKMYNSGYYAEANAEMEKVLGVLSKSDQEVLDNI